MFKVCVAVNVLLVATFICCTKSMRLAGPYCESEVGNYKYEVGKSYFYYYESNFEGFAYKDKIRSTTVPHMQIYGNVSFTFTSTSECECVLHAPHLVVSTYATNRGDVTGTKTLHNLYIKFTLGRGQVASVYVNPTEDAWTQNILRGILTVFQNQNGAVARKTEKAWEVSVYGFCPTSYNAETATKSIHLTECSEGESSSLLSQGEPYKLPDVQERQIYGFLRPGKFCNCTASMENEILSHVTCSESVEGRFRMTGLKSGLKYLHTTDSNFSASDLEPLSFRSNILYNYTDSMPFETSSKAEENIIDLLKLLKTDGSNKAEVFMQLKKSVARARNLEQFQSSDLLNDENRRKMFYDALAAVACNECIAILAKLSKEGALGYFTEFQLFVTIPFVNNPGPLALRAMADLVKNIPGFLGSPPIYPGELPAYIQKVSIAQHMLLGSSGLAYQFCKSNFQNCKTPEYIELVDEIASQLNIKPFQNDENITGSAEIASATLYALGNLPSLTPKAIDAIDEILNGKKVVPDWLVHQGLEAFRRDPCAAPLQKLARSILEDTGYSVQVRVSAYLALSRCCLAPEAIEAIHRVLNSTSEVSSFIASHVRSTTNSPSPSKQSLKADLSQIVIPTDFKHVSKYARVTEYTDFSAFSDKVNFGISAERIVYSSYRPRRPDFASMRITIDLYGKSFHALEFGFSRRLIANQDSYSSGKLDWSFFNGASLARDSYARIFGTTVFMNVAGMIDALYTSATLQKTTGNLHTFFNLFYLDQEVKFPSLMGLPMTFDLAYVASEHFNMQIQSNADCNVSSSNNIPRELKVKVHREAYYLLQSGVSLGENTPLALGHRFMTKLSHRRRYDFEGTSNIRRMMDKMTMHNMKLNIPENALLSYYFDAEGFTYQENSGVARRLKDFDARHSLASKTHRRNCVDIYETGLQGCVTRNSLDDDRIFYNVTLEKPDPNMKGYELVLKVHGRQGYKALLTTPGADVHRELNVISSHNFGTGSPNEAGVVTIESQVREKICKVTVTCEKNKPAVNGTLYSRDYLLLAEYSNDKTNSKIIGAKFVQADVGRAHATLDIPKIFTGDINISVNRSFAHSDLELNLPPIDLKISQVDDFTFDEFEHTRKMKQYIIDTKSLKKITTDMNYIYKIKERSFDIDVAVVESSRIDKLLGKFNGTANFAPEMLNGKSSAAMMLEINGASYSGNVNQVNTVTDDEFISDFDLDFIPPESKPHNSNLKLKYEWKNRDENKYDLQRHFSVKQEAHGANLVPFDVAILDYEFTKLKGKPTFAILTRNNFSNTGILTRQVEMDFRVNDGTSDNLVFTASGFSRDQTAVDHITARLGFSDIKKLRIFNISADVTRTQISDQSIVEKILFSSYNYSVDTRDLFEFNSDLLLKCGEKQHGSRQEIKVNYEELKFLYEVSEVKNKLNDTLLIDVSARVLKEELPPTLVLKEIFNSKYFVVDNVLNFTLTRLDHDDYTYDYVGDDY